MTFDLAGAWGVGVAAGGGAGEAWRGDGGPGGDLHAHGASGHGHHAGLRPAGCPPQPHLRRLCLQGAVGAHRPRPGGASQGRLVLVALCVVPVFSCL